MKLATLLLIISGLAHAAIAFGGTGACPAVGGAFSCTVATSGVNLFMGVEISCGGPLSIAGTAIYGSSTLTAGPIQTGSQYSHGAAWWGLVTAGSQTLTVTISNSGGCAVQYVWYSGATGIAQHAESTCAFTAGSAGTCAETLTTSTPSGWVIGLASWISGNTIGVSLPALQRTAAASNPQIADLGPVSSGPQSITWNACSFCGGANMEATMLELQPATAGAPQIITGAFTATGKTIKQ